MALRAGVRDYDRPRRAAGWLGQPVAAYIRMVVHERVAGDERERGIWEPAHLWGTPRGEGG